MPPRPTLLRRQMLVLGSLLLAAVAVQVAGALVGVERVSLRAALRAPGPERTIVLEARLLRGLLGAVVGSGLASAGVTFQVLLGNPLAEPYILGVSGGAALGAATAILFGGGHLAVALAAFLGSLAAVAFVSSSGRVRGHLVPPIALLAGVVFNAFAYALILAGAFMVRPGQATEMLFWLVGTLSSPAAHELVFPTLGMAVALLWLFGQSARMNALALGEDAAYGLGVDVAGLRAGLFLCGSLLTALTVALAGPIGFVGLLVPHIVRLILGPDHRLLVPAAALTGAVLLSACDILTRLAFLVLGAEPPVGVVTALLGAPFFLLLLRQRRDELLA